MKTIAILTLLLTASSISSCKKKDESTPTPPKPATAETATAPSAPTKKWTAQDTEKVLTACLKAFNAKNEKDALDCYDANVEFSYVDFFPPMSVKGSQALAGILKMWWTAFPDAQGEPQLTLINGNTYASIVLMTQTNTGQGMMPPTGKKTVVLEALVGTLGPDGKIIKEQHFADQSTMAHQMGMHKSEMSPDSETAWPEKFVVIAKNNDYEKANLALAETVSQLVVEQKADDLLNALADNVFFRYIGDKKAYKNKAEYEKGMKEYMSMVKITNRKVETAWAAGDWVFMVSEVTGSMLKDMPGAEGTKGKEIKTNQAEFFQIKDGKIQTHWIFENSMQYPVQMGLIDPAKMGHKPAQ